MLRKPLDVPAAKDSTPPARRVSTAASTRKRPAPAALLIGIITSTVAALSLGIPLFLLALQQNKLSANPGEGIAPLLHGSHYLLWWVLAWILMVAAGLGLWIVHRQRISGQSASTAAEAATDSEHTTVARTDNAGREALSQSVLGQLNQQLITPIGHIRAACDLIAGADEANRYQSALSVTRSAADTMRLTIENLIDHIELRDHRFRTEPRTINIRDQVEDLCAQWQPIAQRRREVVQYLCYRDVPESVTIDSRLLRRLVSTLLASLIFRLDLQDFAVTLMEIDSDERAGTSDLQILIDAAGQATPDELQERLARVEDIPPDNLVGEDDLGLWLAKRFTELLGGQLKALATRPGRLGYQVQFRAERVSAGTPPRQWLARKHCVVLCGSTMTTNSWRGALTGLGASVETNLDGKQRPDLILIDRPAWEALSAEDRARIETDRQSAILIHLCHQISLRGKPAHKPSWADFTLPIFIRSRALQTAISRIINGRPGPGSVTTEKSDESSGQTGSMFAGRTALIIDDDPIYRIHLKRMMASLGIDTLGAANGKEGLSIAGHRDIDLILTDMHMPDINGTGVTRMLRRQQRHQHTPVIAITANIQSDVRHELLEAGVNAVLAKPVAMGELINALTQFFHASNAESAISEAAMDQTASVLNALLCDELPIYRQTLANAGRQRDILRHAAHKLRGAAACCQAKELHEQAGKLEESLHAQIDWQEIERLKQGLIETIDQTASANSCAHSQQRTVTPAAIGSPQNNLM